MKLNERDPVTGYTPVLTAVYHGLPSTLKRMIELGAYINERDRNGYNALAHAANIGREEIFFLLLENHADLDLKIIVLAARNGNLKIIEKLVEIVKDFHLFNLDVLRHSINSPSVFKFLVEKVGVKENIEKAILLSNCPNYETFKIMEEKGWLDDVKDKLSLHHFVEAHEEVLKEMIKRGLKVNERDMRGANPLANASSKEAAQILFDAGGDLMQKDYNNETAKNKLTMRGIELPKKKS